MRGGGSSWKDAATAAGLDYRTLRRYIKQHPDAVELLEEQTKDSLDQSHNTLIAAAPAVAQRLLEIALDPKTKNYDLFSSAGKFAAAGTTGGDKSLSIGDAPVLFPPWLVHQVPGTTPDDVVRVSFSFNLLGKWAWSV